MSSHHHAKRLYIGTSAEKSALSLTTDGRGIIWYDTDEDRAYIWSGSAWVETTKVSEVWESDGGAVALQADASGNIGIGAAPSGAKLDVDTGSNTTGLRLRGLAETTEIADLYVGPLGNLVIDLTPGNDTNQFIDLRSEDTSYGVVIRESDGTGTSTFANLFVTDAATDYLNIVINTTNATPGLVINDDDRVGIKQIAPLRSLHVGAGTDSPTQSGDGVYVAIDGIAEMTVRNTSGNIEGGMFAHTNTIFYAGTWTNHELHIRTNNTDRITVDTSGKVGIGTTAIPHGGVGTGMIAVDGPNASDSGPFMQFTTASNDYPVMVLLPYSHDNSQIIFDGYLGSGGAGWRSSDAGSNAKLMKYSDEFVIAYDSGVAAGSLVTWNNGLVMDLTNGQIGVGGSPSVPLEVIQVGTGEQIRIRDSSATGNPFISFYQTSTRRSYLQHQDSADVFAMVSEYGPVLLSSEASYVDVRPTSASYGMLLRDSSGAGTTPYANFYVVNTTKDYLNIVITNSVATLGFVVTEDENIGLRTATQFGSGTGVFGVANAGTNPSTNPSGGGVLYSDGGAGKWRGISGTTTTFGPAQPHCPICGRDAVLEMRNDDEGWHIVLCWTCFLRETMGNNLQKPNWIIEHKGVLN